MPTSSTCVLLPFRPTPTGPHTLNAIAPHQSAEAAAERTARHLAMCQELAELGMQLARAAAARAMADWAAKDHPPAEAEAETPAKTPPRPKPEPRIANPGLLYARLSRTIRDCIDLEARIAAGPEAAKSRTRARTCPSALALADPRRDIVRFSLENLTKKRPDRSQIRREAYIQLDEELTIDADRTLCIQELLSNVCDELDIEIDWAVLPDEMVGMGIPEPDPPDFSEYNNHDWWKSAIPAATGPP